MNFFEGNVEYHIGPFKLPQLDFAFKSAIGRLGCVQKIWIYTWKLKMIFGFYNSKTSWIV